MTSRCLWCVVLIVTLSVVFVTPARANSSETGAKEVVIGIAAGAAAVGVIATMLIIHYSKKRTITGCIHSADKGMTITDEKDAQMYALSGNTADIRPGDRMSLQGKKVKSKGSDSTLTWEAKKVTKDFGVCQP